ncbi:unnamed protein product [Oncorhynchus mykiss]|uniref:Uncharacterized protein n=1 Tax=Oncorhynchus mykiss TaxID=8022 RepID=A0A060YER4_ONCMY|nr:unnamed protein product [Oncorhynchus mykiss]
MVCNCTWGQRFVMQIETIPLYLTGIFSLITGRRMTSPPISGWCTSEAPEESPASTTLSRKSGSSCNPATSPMTHWKSGLSIKAGRSVGYSALPSASERTPSRPKVTEKIVLGSYGNSAFQPITGSCKIVPQGQAPSPSGSPGISFQPITMSCKIVSGSYLPIGFVGIVADGGRVVDKGWNC